MVTPTYWGSPWPLSRGKWTGWTIDDRIHSTPASNSVITFGFDFPKPLWTGQITMPDAVGRARRNLIQRWVALIAKTDAPDAVLLAWAHGFSQPPSVTVTGARLDFPSYSPERRAIRLVVESSSMEVELIPAKRAVNPVFELEGVPGELTGVTLDGKPLPKEGNEWDGATLWVKTSIDISGAKVGMQFQ